MIPTFLRPEVLPVASVDVVCAWCPGFTARGVGVSHGICPACRARLEAELAHDDDPREEFAGSTCGANCGYCGRCS